jgi:two-component sensor histidine kinase/sensor domain CHASE-containing protein
VFRRLQASAPVGLLIVAALLSALAVLWIVNSARVRTDQIAAEREQRVAENGFRQRIKDMQKAVTTETVWDDAVRHLDRSFDRAWAEANMVSFFQETSGYELVTVLDAKGQPILSHLPGPDENRTWTQVRGDVARMVDSIRAREVMIQRPPGARPSKTLISAPVDVTTVVRIDGQPYLLTAALVQPDFGTAEPSKMAPVVVVGDAIDAKFLKNLGDAFLLHDVKLFPPGVAAPAGMSMLPVRNLEGRPLAAIGWTPEAPAGDLVSHLWLPLAALSLLLLIGPIGLVVWEQRRASQLQQRVAERDAAMIELRATMDSMVQLQDHTARQKVLLDELNHRVKNSLASVQSIALQTLKNATDMDEFGETFQSRLIALSQTHELLVNGRWSSVTLSALLRQHLDHYGKRYAIEGEDLLLSPNYTTSLGLAFHELATNALKYGAWSKGDRGMVAIRVEDIGDGEMFELTWTERGGPEVASPERAGFGSRLLRSVGLEMGGGSSTHYGPGGLVYRVGIAVCDGVKPLGLVRAMAKPA